MSNFNAHEDVLDTACQMIADYCGICLDKASKALRESEEAAGVELKVTSREHLRNAHYYKRCADECDGLIACLRANFNTPAELAEIDARLGLPVEQEVCDG